MARIAYHSTRNNNMERDPVILLIIDPQVDFHEGGSLEIQGANKDSERVANMIKENCNRIDQIYITLDTHHRNHIAHAIVWTDREDGNGSNPPSFTQIRHEDVGNKWFPTDMSLLEHCKDYTLALSKLYPPRHLIIWPEHCLIGSEGHAVVDPINEAIAMWSYNNLQRDVHFVHKETIFKIGYTRVQSYSET